MVIVCVSDTHLLPGRLLPESVLATIGELQPAHILHAGDILHRAVLEQLCTLAPTVAVAGNMDPAALAHELGYTQTLELAGVIIGLTHGHLGRGATTPERAASHFPGAAVVVFGHSHRPLCQRQGAQLMLNPGSPTQPRMARGPSLGVIRVGEGGRVEGEVVSL